MIPSIWHNLHLYIFISIMSITIYDDGDIMLPQGPKMFSSQWWASLFPIPCLFLISNRSTSSEGRWQLRNLLRYLGLELQIPNSWSFLHFYFIYFFIVSVDASAIPILQWPISNTLSKPMPFRPGPDQRPRWILATIIRGPPKPVRPARPRSCTSTSRYQALNN